MSHPQTEKATGRTSTLLTAIIRWSGGSAEIIIRNISEMGALIDATAPIPTHSRVVLQREDLEVEGRIVWQKSQTFGIKFTSVVNPAIWMGEKISEPMSPKSGSIEKLLAEQYDVTSLLNGRLSEEICYAVRLIESAASVLIKDVVMCNRYQTQLQNLSIAVQMLAEIGSVVAADNKLGKIQSSVSGPMKQRILR